MVTQSISVQPPNPGNLQEVIRVLRSGPVKLVGPKGQSTTLPEPLYGLLKDIVKRLSDGNSLVVMPEEKQLTTQQAGELLGMSRPYLIQLLDAGEMPFALVGKHRRIALRDVLSYSKRRAEARKSALDQMARDAYEAGLYDDENAAMPLGGQDE